MSVTKISGHTCNEIKSAAQVEMWLCHVYFCHYQTHQETSPLEDFYHLTPLLKLHFKG